SGCRLHTLERLAEEGVLVRRADGDPNRIPRPEARERPDDDALAEQRLEERLGILVETRVEEVGDGRPDRLEPVCSQDALELDPPLGVEPSAPLELVGGVEAGEG